MIKIREFILKIIGSDEVIGTLLRENAISVEKISTLETEILRLKAEGMGKDAQIRKTVRVLDPRSADPEPTDINARKEYVAEVANFFDGIGEKKVLHMIATVREQLDDVWTSGPPPGMTRYDYDNFLRGTSNAFKVLLDWADLMRGEHAQNIKPVTPNE